MKQINYSRWGYLLLLCLSALFFSCKKDNGIQETVFEENRTEKFFALREPLNSKIEPIYQELKRKDQSEHFVNRLPKGVGNPIWNKIKIHNEQESTNSLGDLNNNSLEEGEEYLIPLTNNYYVLSGVLVGKETDTGVVLQVFTDADLYNECHKPNPDIQKAEQELSLFMILDNYCFGTTYFTNIPKELFPNSLNLDTVDGKKSVILVPEMSGINSIMHVEVCVTVLFECPPTGRENSVAVCAYTTCHTTWLEEDNTGGGGGGGTGGGNGEGGSGGGGSGSGGGTGGGGSGSGGSGCLVFYRANCGDAVPITPNSASVLFLKNSLNLNNQRIEWLNYHLEEADILKQAIDESRIPLDNGIIMNDPAALGAAKMAIDAAMAGYIHGSYTTEHYNIIKPYIPNSSLHPNIDPIFWLHFRIQCALIKIEHPEWNSFKVYWEASRELIHTGLDVMGAVPVIGEVADLANGIIYTLEGDGVNATLSYASMIPVAGWVSVGIKYATKGVTIANGTKTTLKWMVRTDNIIDFGDRSQLRKILGLTVNDARKAHHLIPWQLGTHQVVQKAASGNSAFHLNELLNGIPLSSAVHSGSHAAYNARVMSKLDQILINNPGITPDLARSKLQDLANLIRTTIQNNPNTHINNLVF